MSVGREARLKDLFGKAIHIGPEVVRKPQLALMGAKGVHLASYLSLQAPWIRTAGIHTVLDIGANTGQFASAIHHVLPEARIYSFEPLPSCYEKLTQRLTDTDRFQSFNVALGEEPGQITFYQNDFAKSSSPLVMTDVHKEAFPWTARATPITLNVQPLDSYAQHLDLTPKVLIKIDVQGFEDRVLRGGPSVIQAADFVFVETSFAPLYEDQADFHTVYQIMQNYGFRLDGFMDQLTDPRDGRVLQGDAIFVRHSVSS